MYEVGDPVAKQALKEEIAMRLESGAPNVIEYLWQERLLDYLTLNELTTVIESPNFVKNLLQYIDKFRTFDLIDSLLFIKSINLNLYIFILL